jgi:hypothetical protein
LSEAKAGSGDRAEPLFPDFASLNPGYGFANWRQDDRKAGTPLPFLGPSRFRASRGRRFPSRDREPTARTMQRVANLYRALTERRATFRET